MEILCKTLCLPVSSADITFANSLDPDQARRFGIPERIFLKKLILKKISRQQNCMQNYPVCKEFIASKIGEFTNTYPVESVMVAPQISSPDDP